MRFRQIELCINWFYFSYIFSHSREQFDITTFHWDKRLLTRGNEGYYGQKDRVNVNPIWAQTLVGPTFKGFLLSYNYPSQN